MRKLRLLKVWSMPIDRLLISISINTIQIYHIDISYARMTTYFLYHSSCIVCLALQRNLWLPLQPFSPSADLPRPGWHRSWKPAFAPKEHVEKGSFRDVFLKLCWSLSGKLVENEKERIPDKLFFTSIFVELLSCNDWISPMFKPVPMFPMRPLRFWCGTKETSHVGRPCKSSVNHLQHVGKVMVWLSF